MILADAPQPPSDTLSPIIFFKSHEKDLPLSDKKTDTVHHQLSAEGPKHFHTYFVHESAENLK